MSTAPTPKLTPAQYLAIERKAAFKSEYLDGEMFAMAGASFPHNRAKDNLARHAGNQLNGGRCAVVTSDMRVKVSTTGLYTYPEVVIICDPPEFEDDRQDVLLNPQVVIEVLSDSTESYDRGAKFRHYQQVRSMREYVLVAQDEPACDQFVRQPDGKWLLTTATGLGAELALATVPVRIPLAEVYAGVIFPEKPTR